MSDLCLINIIYFNPEEGFYYKELSGLASLIEDAQEAIENIEILAKVRFWKRIGFTWWLLDKISFEKNGVIYDR